MPSERRVWGSHRGPNQRVREYNIWNGQRKQCSEKKKIVMLYGWQLKIGSKKPIMLTSLKKEKK